MAVVLQDPGSRVGDPGGTKGDHKAFFVLVGSTVHHHPLSPPLLLALLISLSLSLLIYFSPLSLSSPLFSPLDTLGHSGSFGWSIGEVPSTSIRTNTGRAPRTQNLWCPIPACVSHTKPLVRAGAYGITSGGPMRLSGNDAGLPQQMDQALQRLFSLCVPHQKYVLYASFVL